MEINSTNIIDVLAYYLSEYDTKAFETLGFHTQAKGFDTLGPLFGKKSSYLRRLRDEYDVVTSSYRNGQRNRPPRQRISDTKNYLSSFSFEELTEIIQAFIENANETIPSKSTSNPKVDPSLSEEEIEYIINFQDPTATVTHKEGNLTLRNYNTSIIRQLKKLYKGKCQICGCKPFADIEVDITEAHHIEYFSESHNNNSSNIIILCPNHHRAIHKAKPSFDPQNMEFVFKDGKKELIKLDMHIKK